MLFSMGIRVPRPLLAFAAALAAAVSKVDACRCYPVEVCAGVADSTVVVHAEALSRSDQENINDPVTYTVRTLTLYKYPTEPNVRMAFPEEITFSTAGNGGLCGVTLEIGSEYLIGLTLSDEDELTANSCDLYRGWSTLTDEELSLLEAGCGEDGGEEEDPCEGACTEFQDCLLFEPPEEQQDAEVWYCADFCGPDNCPSEGEVCELLPTPCADSSAPCPPEAVCQQQCDPECDENQECVYYDFIGFSCEFETCDPSPCAANETCTILESFPPIVVCSDRCEALECGQFQECLVYAEGTGDEEPYCADSCAAGTCGDGQACILEQVQCIRAPCPPFAVCADTPTPAPVTEPPTAGGGEYMGCYKDTKEDRVLANPLVSTAMTTDLCLYHCIAEGAAYAGTQYGNECWCYVSGRSDFDRHGDGGVCDMPCDGNEEETCGGTWALSLYKLDWPAAPVDDPEYLDCYRDDGSDRVMTDKITRDDMTPAVCREHCLDKDAAFYGTQYSSECWCGSSSSISDYDRHGEGVCHLECSGEPGLACGGNYAFDLFQF